MSVNKEAPHVYVLPEDDANRQLANGFTNAISLDLQRIQVLPPAGGWTDVLERFEDEYISSLEKYRHKHMIMLIDFDGDSSRLDDVRAVIPVHLRPRVFALGVSNEPERLKAALHRSLEDIGLTLGDECREDDVETTWNHPLLAHNHAELERLREVVRPFLFNEN